MRSHTSLSLRRLRAADPGAALNGAYAALDNSRIQLDASPFAVIGSDPGVHVPIHSPNLDGCHAKIERGPDDAWFITDLGSLCGTRVGGIALYPKLPRVLPPRALIEVADVLIEATHGVRPFESWASRGQPDIARARLLGEKAERDAYAIRLLVVQGPGLLDSKAPLLHPRRRPYSFGSSRLCEFRLPHEHVPDEAFAVLVGEGDRIRVINRQPKPLYLGYRAVHLGEVAAWYPLAMLWFGPHVFALGDPVAVALEESELQSEVVMTELNS